MEMPEDMTSERRTPLYEAYHSNRYERQALISQYQEQYECSLVILSDFFLQADSVPFLEETLSDADSSLIDTAEMIRQLCFKLRVRVHIVKLARRKMEEDYSQTTEARRIAIEAGVIARCEWHPDIILYQFTDDTQAYRFANAKYNKGELEDLFGSREELNDAIKSVIEDVAADGCPACQKLLE